MTQRFLKALNTKFYPFSYHKNYENLKKMIFNVQSKLRKSRILEKTLLLNFGFLIKLFLYIYAFTEEYYIHNH